MVDFIIKEPDSFQLNSVIKNYKLDQDKYIHPKATYRNTLRTLKRAFPEKKFTLNEIKITKKISAYDFGDETFNNHGKGATKNQSKASAIMEYTERFSWINFDYKNSPCYKKISFTELRKNHDIDNIEKSFYIAYSHKKEKLGKLVKDIPLDWIHAYSLTKNKLTYYPVNWNNNYVSSNGLAAGNIKEEAILQGICEVIERHNVSNLVENLSNISTELIDINSLDSNIIKNLAEAFKENNIDIYLINATYDLKIPTIMALCIDKKPALEIVRLGFGYGCHTDPQKAIIRALAEYYQLREGVLKEKERIHPDFKFQKGQWQFNLNIDTDKILNKSKVISYKELPDLSNNDIKDEILNLVELLAKKDFEVIIANKTHPKLNIPVYRIFVPGFLPGTAISSVHENDDLLMILAYYQGGQIDKANEYYKDNFESFIKNMELILKLHVPDFQAEPSLIFFTPQMFPLKNFCRQDYTEQNKLMYYLGRENG